MLIIPKLPKTVSLSIGRLWNGEKSHDSRLLSVVELAQDKMGILVRSTTLPISGYKIPESLHGEHCANLDAFERVCVFFVEESGQYLEVKLGLGGQYSVLGFDKPLEVVADFSETKFKTNHLVVKDGKIINEILLPIEIFPTSLKAINAFFFSGNQVLAYHPLSGHEPNPHQPETFPLAKLEE